MGDLDRQALVLLAGDIEAEHHVMPLCMCFAALLRNALENLALLRQMQRIRGYYRTLAPEADEQRSAIASSLGSGAGGSWPATGDVATPDPTVGIGMKVPL